MLHTKRLQTAILIKVLLTLFCHSYSANTVSKNKHSQLYLKNGVARYNQKWEHPDTTLQAILGNYKQKINQKDSTTAILYLLEASDIERFSGNYEESFEYLWEAASLTKKNPNNPINIRINRNLGILYDIYNKDQQTLIHLDKALIQAKLYAKQATIDSAEILHCYFSIATHYRGNGQFQKSLLYLDSCQNLFNDKRFLPYVNADKGFVYLKLGEIEKAEQQLNSVKPFFIKTQNKYWCVVSSFIGDVKVELNQIDSAIYYYNKSLDEIEKHEIHIEYKPIVLEKLSKLHFNKGDYAYSYIILSNSKQSMDSLFNITYKRNNKLFEIKNTYQEKLIKNETIIQEQSETIIKKSKTLNLLLLSLIAISTIGFFIFFIVRQKMKIKRLQVNKLFEKDKTEAILKLKSKEITTYALQMVEKEQSVQELLNVIKEENPKQYKNLEKKHLNQSKKLWENFNKRFLEVNNDFYKTINKKHPTLTPTELKHCALIRLKFDNNELTQILNISLQAVHTSRYRIRKKIGLERDENLGDYIASL